MIVVMMTMLLMAAIAARRLELDLQVGAQVEPADVENLRERDIAKRDHALWRAGVHAPQPVGQGRELGRRMGLRPRRLASVIAL